MTLSKLLMLKLRRLNMKDEEMKDLDDKSAQELIDQLDPKPSSEPVKAENQKVGEIKEFKGVDESQERIENRKPDLVIPYSAEELFDPNQTDDSRLNRADKTDGRILRIYDDRSPEGRIL